MINRPSVTHHLSVSKFAKNYLKSLLTMANYWSNMLSMIGNIWSGNIFNNDQPGYTKLAHAILQQQRLAKSLMACWPFSTCWLSLIKDLHVQICRDSLDAARRMDLSHGRYRRSDRCHLHEFLILLFFVYFLFYIYIFCAP